MQINGRKIAIEGVGGSNNRLTFIDLFCGCGGFTLGMLRAGFRCLAAIDSNPEAIAVLNANLAMRRRRHLSTVEHVLERDLMKLDPNVLAGVIGTHQVDVIVGGPPCQGYSLARQVDGANHGKRLKDDDRRDLYKELLRFIDHFQPRVFVMENVLGLRSAAGGDYFTRVQREARELGRSVGKPGYRVHDQIEDAWELGAPQKRRRQLIVGVRADLPGYFLPTLRPSRRAVPRITLGACIADLPILRAGKGDENREYDLKRRATQVRLYGKNSRRFLGHVLQISYATKLTNHVARQHSARDLRDFARLREGETSHGAMRRGVKFEFPYDKSSFKDRYTRQSRFKACSTIVAHISKDGLMFIHPTQNRSLTPREAARVQTFPDWFDFPVSRTHAYRLIGNAVPPLVAEAAGNAIDKFLRTQRHMIISRERRPPVVQRGPLYEEATEILQRFAELSRSELKSLPKAEFLRGWRALLQLFPTLHPVNALDHGVSREDWPEAIRILPNLARARRRRYKRSGWPVALVPVGLEAWRRLKARKLTHRDIYFTGIHDRLFDRAVEHVS
ncbi:MAG: DNA cytosine methyltransferase [Steroidobacteraceae bacterium]